MEAFNYIDPPILDKEDFGFWKFQMKHSMNMVHTSLWKSVIDGPYVPMTVPDDGGVATPKERSNYTDEDMKRIQGDKKAHAVLTMALPDEIYIRHSHNKTAKELWDSLCKEFDESADVRAYKAELLIEQYELFNYISGESMTQQFDRFMSLVSKLHRYEVIYKNVHLLNKFMRSLPGQWSMYTMIIKMSADLTKMTLCELYSKLRNYELKLNQDIRVCPGGIQVEETLITGGSHYSTVTFEDLLQLDPDDAEEIDLKYTVASWTRRAERFLQRTGRSLDGTPMMRFEFYKSRARCKNCQKTGHFARECESPRAAPVQATTSDQGFFTGESFDWSNFSVKD